MKVRDCALIIEMLSVEPAFYTMDIQNAGLEGERNTLSPEYTHRFPTALKTTPVNMSTGVVICVMHCLKAMHYTYLTLVLCTGAATTELQTGRRNNNQRINPSFSCTLNNRGQKEDLPYMAYLYTQNAHYWFYLQTQYS